MSAAGVQRAVLRLLLDPGARESMLAHEGERFRSDYQLTATELQQLRDLVHENSGGMEFFSGLLASKRKARAKATLPLTFAALGPIRWAEAWAAFCARSRSEAVSDGLEFARFLRTEKLRPAIVEEIVRYEAAKLELAAAPATRAPAHALDPRELSSGLNALYPVLRQPSRIERFRYDLRGIIRAGPAGGESVEPPQSRTTFLMCQGSGGGTSTARIGEGLARVLVRCDGCQSLGAVVAELGLASKHGTVETAVVALAERGLVLLLTRPLGRIDA